MKKTFLRNEQNGSVKKPRLNACLWLTLLFLLTEIPALGSSELDRQYKLETIGYLKSFDNMDGLFSEYVDSAYKEFFSHQTRFILNDLSKADAILSRSKLPYSKVLHDREILAQLSRTTRTESIIRTEVRKQGREYYFIQEWLHGPHMELMATETFGMQEPSDGKPFAPSALSELITSHLEALIKKVPFFALVTGRDNNSVTINLGVGSKIKKGDVLSVSTLDEVKTHPLLNQVLDWKLSPTGKVTVEQIEDGMAFCRILEEEPNREISRFQKITLIQNTPSKETSPVIHEKINETPRDPGEMPTLGWVSGGLTLGSFSRQFSSLAGAISNTGSGIALGAQAEGEIWLTQTWFANAQFGYDFWNYSQTATSTGTPSAASASGGVGGSFSTLKLDLGYAYLINGDFYGPKGWVKFGIKNLDYGLPISSTENTGPVSFTSFFVGIGGSMPIRGPWGVITNLNFRLLSLVGQSWVSDTISGNSDIEFYLGGYYQLNPRMSIKAGFEVIATGLDFTAGSTLSQKTITFAPSLLYYF